MNFHAQYLANLLLAPIARQYKTLKLRNRSIRLHPENLRTGSIFVHIPKTGGFSVALALLGRDPWHFSLREYGEIADLTAFHTFAVVREPASRLYSMFRYLKALPYAHPSVTRLQCAGSFAEFCRHFVALSSAYAHPFLRFQLDFTRLAECPVAVDSLLRFERLNDDYLRLRERLDLPPAPLPHLNKSRSTLPLTQADRRLVEKLLPEEYEVFGY